MKNIQYARVGTVRQMKIGGEVVSNNQQSVIENINNAEDSINLNSKNPLLCK